VAETTLTSKGESVEAGVIKRTRSEHNTPSATEDRRGQRPKISDQRSYVQTIRGIIRMTLVPKDYPDRKLGDDEVRASRKQIREHILGFPENALASTFTGI